MNLKTIINHHSETRSAQHQPSSVHQPGNDQNNFSLSQFQTFSRANFGMDGHVILIIIITSGRADFDLCAIWKAYKCKSRGTFLHKILPFWVRVVPTAGSGLSSHHQIDRESILTRYTSLISLQIGKRINDDLLNLFCTKSSKKSHKIFM